MNIFDQDRGAAGLADEPLRAAMIEGMAQIGFDITHVYDLTEVYGPAGVPVERASWSNESLSEQTRLNGRQGVRYPLQEGMTMLDPETMAPTPADGQAMGEIVFRGNVVMKGYLKKSAATAKAFEGGWVARPDAKWGETPVAFVELKPGSNAAAAELIAHCRGLLAGYKVRREVCFEPIPKTSTGKIQKFTLRELAAAASPPNETPK